jgi:hypothetical protein
MTTGVLRYHRSPKDRFTPGWTTGIRAGIVTGQLAGTIVHAKGSGGIASPETHWKVFSCLIRNSLYLCSMKKTPKKISQRAAFKLRAENNRLRQRVRDMGLDYPDGKSLHTLKYEETHFEAVRVARLLGHTVVAVIGNEASKTIRHVAVPKIDEK